MKRFKMLLVAALFALTTITGVGAAHAAYSNPLGVDFTPVLENTGTKTSFGSDINIIGWAFSVNQSFDIKGLGYFANNGILTESHDVALYRSSGELVASTTVNTNDELLGAAQWRFHNIPTTNLSVGNYVIAATVGADLYTYNPSNTIWHSNIAYTGDVFDSTNQALPKTWASLESAGVDTGSFGPNFVATPIPAAAWLLGSGLLGLAGFRRKNK
ncbi:MAG: VPLPA-CTERM sorting domain-containing protein [Pedobacter sp.]